MYKSIAYSLWAVASAIVIATLVWGLSWHVVVYPDRPGITQIQPLTGCTRVYGNTEMRPSSGAWHILK